MPGREEAARGTLKAAWLAFVAVAGLGCASVDARLAEGRRLSAQGDWGRALEAFSDVRSRISCTTMTDRCKEVILGQAEANIRLGTPQDAYWLLAQSQGLWPPVGPADERTLAIQKEAQRALESRLARRPGHATLRVAFESHTGASFTPTSAAVTLDLSPIPLLGLNDAKEGPVKASTATTAISAGEHEIEAFTRYASGGRLPPDYRIMVRDRKKFEVADGDAVEIQIRFSERPAWSSSAEAVEVTIQVRRALPQ